MAKKKAKKQRPRKRRSRNLCTALAEAVAQRTCPQCGHAL